MVFECHLGIQGPEGEEVNTSVGFIERYPERIGHVHVHDNKGGDSALDDLHLVPGEGIIDFDRIFERLKEMAYDRTMTLELKPPEIARCLGDVKTLLLRNKLQAF
jgi:sugar phosphate isomerase/epimerase